MRTSEGAVEDSLPRDRPVQAVAMPLSRAARDLAMLVSQPREDPVACYDRVARDYERLHRRFLRHGGEHAVGRLCDGAQRFLRPGADLLELGAGTGDLTRRLLQCQPHARVTAVDASFNMLTRCPQEVRRIQADAALLPFAAESFDLVVSAWLLEAVPDVAAVLREACRVLRSGGWIGMCFCHARRWGADAATRALLAVGFGSRPVPVPCLDVTDLEFSVWQTSRVTVVDAHKV